MSIPDRVAGPALRLATGQLQYAHARFLVWLMLNIIFVVNQDTLAFLAWIWAHNPVIIVLLAGISALFSLVVIDTHRYRKKEHRKRDMGNHHP